MYSLCELGVEQPEDRDDGTENGCDDSDDGGSGTRVWDESGVAGEIVNWGLDIGPGFIDVVVRRVVCGGV